MDDLTASILTLILVSPAIVVLYVLIARGAHGVWKACVLSARAKLKEAMERKVQFHSKLCGDKLDTCGT
jgi:hypothetical protein